MNRRLAGFIVATLSLVAAANAADGIPEPEGYRTDNYRAAVPATLKGARVVTDTDSHTDGCRRRTAAMTLPLPTPDGPDRTVSRPFTRC